MVNQDDNVAEMAKVLLDMAGLMEGVERQLHAIAARLARLERERGDIVVGRLDDMISIDALDAALRALQDEPA